MIKEYIQELEKILEKVEEEKINNLVKKILDVRDREGNIFIIGNGGSSANASHWACDLSKGTLTRHYDSTQKRIRATSLSDNVATCTALANDLGYEEIFSQQLRNLIRPGDLLIAMTGSGNSKNIINAINVTRNSKAYVFSLVGECGGEVLHISEDAIVIPSKNYGIIEDLYSIIGHIVTESIRNKSNYIK